mmetsp:Transcript_57306/g.153464  ORF Transcript_57306/g.153464 Transcript_57306/m.153464 type:complete len:128 (-) Transcript_57306:56-439(-)
MSKRRTSLTGEEADDPSRHDGDTHEKMNQNEMKFNYKAQKLQTDLEMWVMEEMPGVFGVEDSDELREELQEDGQADLIEKVVHAKDTEGMRTMIIKWMGDGAGGGRDDFVGSFVSKSLKVQIAAKKK